MNLTFSRRAKLQGIEHNTEFERRIKRGDKIHTIRKGDRWNPGMKIHFYIGTPRNPSSDPQRFFVNLGVAEFWASPYSTGKKGFRINSKRDLFDKRLSLFDPPNTDYYLPVCAATEKIIMRNLRGEWPTVQVGRKMLTASEIVTLSQNDGFELVEDFFDWFRKPVRVIAYWSDVKGKHVYKNEVPDEFEGQIVHWTTHLYNPETANVLKV